MSFAFERRHMSRVSLRLASVASAALMVLVLSPQDSFARSRSHSSHKGGAKVAKVWTGHHSRWHGSWRDRSHEKRKSQTVSRSRADEEDDTPAKPVAAAPKPVADAPRPAPAVAAIAAPATINGAAFVSIAIGGVTSTSARVASDLSAVLDGDNLRILPVMTHASLQEVLALAQADKTDLAFLHSDAMAGLSAADRAATRNRISYVARLYNEEIHVVAGREIADIHDLSAKKVNVGPVDSANAQTAQLIFDRLGIVPNYVNLDQPTALAQLAAGEIAADVLIAGRPVKALQDFAGDGRFKLLSVPYEVDLQESYLPAKIEAIDYGNLVPPGQSVATLAVPIVLAAIDATPGTPRAARVERFTQSLFEKFDALRDPMRHPKWRDVNLAADVANWNRFAAAQTAIDRTTARSVGVNAPNTSGQPPKNSQQPSQEFQQWTLEKAR
jgi:TRAP-type uncharacterized transport system substrate-binding protein